MKKLFISLVAIAAAVFATSCTNDLVDSVNGYEGKTAKVGIEVSTPELATRTFGDGKSATNLYYGVYDEYGVLLPEISVIDTAAEINIKTTVNLELVTGDTYTIVFWAENAGSAATIDWANKKMTFDPTTASKEEYDAFYGKIEFKVEGPATLKADLVRPFAQVNIGTADYENAQKAGMEVKDVMVKVKGFDTMDLFSAEATNVVEHEYAYAVAPTEAFPVAGYEYMSMNYVLVNATKHLVDVEMTYRNTENKKYDVVYGNVPVQRNYRTNIYGNLLTDQTGVIVEIKPAFEDDAADVDPYIRPWDGTMEQPAIDGNTVYIATGEQLAFLANAINTGATFDNAQTRAEVKYAYANVVLTHDIDLNKKAWTPIGNQPYSAEGQFRGTFDGQGHTIKGLKVKQAKYAGLFATAHNSFTVKDLVIDDFELEGNHYAGAILAWGEGGVNITNCVVKNGQVTVEPEEVDGKMDNGDKAGGLAGYIYKGVVKGCSVEDVTVKAYRDLGGLVGCASTAGTYEKNVVKNVEVIADQTVEYGSVKAPNAGEIVGRAFDGIDLSTNYTENVGVKVSTVPGILVEGNSYTAVEGVDEAKALETIMAMIADSNAEEATISIAKDVTLEWATGAAHGSTPFLGEGVNTKLTIEGPGTFKATGSGVGPIRVVENELIFKNLTIVDESVSYNEGAWELGYLEMGGNLTFENVTFPNAIMISGENANFKNCTFVSSKDSEYAMWLDNGSAKFDGCKVSGTRGFKVHEAYGSEVNTLEIINCEFGPLSKKPGLAIGDLNKNTKVILRNNTFEGCQAGDNGNYVFESDTELDKFTFIAEGNTVVGGAPAIELAAGATAEEVEAAVSIPFATVNMPQGEFTFPASSIAPNVTIVCEEGTVFAGNSKLNIKGATVVGATFSNDGGTAVDQTINGTFKGCTFDGYNALRWCYAGETVVFDDCVFSGDLYGVHFDGGANEVVFKNCTFSGFNAMGGAITQLTLEGCTFKANGRSGYNGINMWGNTYMKDCEFTFDGTVTEWVDACGDNKTYEFEGCTVNGTPITAEQIGNYGEGNTIIVK